MGNLFQGYMQETFFDEMFESSGDVRSHYRWLFDRYGRMSAEEFQKKRTIADNAFLTQGVTFTVYNDQEGTERIFPFDLIPAHHSPRRMGTRGTRPHPTYHRPESLPA